MAGCLVWRWTKLIVLAVLVATAGSMAARAQGSDDLAALRDQVGRLYSQGKHAEAVPVAQRYVSLARRRHGEKHAEFATAIFWLALLHDSQNRYAEAEPLYKRSLTIREKALGPEHPSVGTTLNYLALLVAAQGRYAEAEPLLKRALAIREKTLEADHPDVGTSLYNLARVYRAQGRYAEAEPLYRRSLALHEKKRGIDDPFIGTLLMSLAETIESQGRYDEAEPLAKRTLTIWEKALGPGHADVGQAQFTLARLHREQSRYSDAEAMFKRSLSNWEKALGRDHVAVARALSSLARLYFDAGRYTEAEPLFKRSIEIQEGTQSPNQVEVAAALNDLAVLYKHLGRYAEAELLYKRAIEIDATSVATLDNLAVLLKQQFRHAEAEHFYKRALALEEKTLPADHPRIAQLLSNLSALYLEQDRNAEADPLLRRALKINQAMLPADHPQIAFNLHNLAVLHVNQGRLTEAEPLYRRAIEINDRSVGAYHPEFGKSLFSLGSLLLKLGRPVEALQILRRASAILATRRAEGADGREVNKRDELTSKRYWLRQHVEAASRVMEADATQTIALKAETFGIAQRALDTEAAAALSQAIIRHGTENAPTTELVRESQDLENEWRDVDRQLSAALALPPERRNGVDQRARARAAAIEDRIREIDALVKVRSPDYAALVNPEPLTIDEVQSLLRPAEALVLFLANPRTFIWVITKSDSRWVPGELDTEALRERVVALRCGLDHLVWKGDSRQDQCVAMLNNKHRYQATIDGRIVDVLPFDLQRAHALYKALLGPVEDMIKDKHLLVVPSGPLTSLPFSVLVTEAPKTGIPNDPAQYREAAWLGTRQPVTVLPSVASLKALRQFAKTSRASKPYLGIGNPLLDGPQGHPIWGAHYKKEAELAREKQRCAGPPSRQQVAAARGPRSAAGFASVFRGTQADIEVVRQFTPLPETTDELCDVARSLGVPESEILLGARATETALKELSAKGQLTQYAIVHFATHGALTGQVEGLAEPGLVLTPPAKGTSDPKLLERDDGFLTASEIAALKLDADWVILSACNTAGSGGETAALSGLARAFFYAGARALIVSHWEVGSEAAVKLTTRAFAEMSANPKISRADAFRTAMRALIEQGASFDAHPSQWAPFVVVGEGAAAR